MLKSNATVVLYGALAACAPAAGGWWPRGLPLYLEQLYNDVNLLLQTTWLPLLLAGAQQSDADLHSNVHTQTRPPERDIAELQQGQGKWGPATVIFVSTLIRTTRFL